MRKRKRGEKGKAEQNEKINGIMKTGNREKEGRKNKTEKVRKKIEKD